METINNGSGQVTFLSSGLIDKPAPSGDSDKIRMRHSEWSPIRQPEDEGFEGLLVENFTDHFYIHKSSQISNASSASISLSRSSFGPFGLSA